MKITKVQVTQKIIQAKDYQYGLEIKLQDIKQELSTIELANIDFESRNAMDKQRSMIQQTNKRYAELVKQEVELDSEIKAIKSRNGFLIDMFMSNQENQGMLDLVYKELMDGDLDVTFQELMESYTVLYPSGDSIVSMYITDKGVMNLQIGEDNDCILCKVKPEDKVEFKDDGMFTVEFDDGYEYDLKAIRNKTIG